jgi:ureidoacrylate peracid hydrolase
MRSARRAAPISARSSRWCPARAGEPLIAPHLKKLRPFLGKGDFAPGSFGHSLVDELPRPIYTVEKVAYSAFYQTRLEYILRALDIDTLIVGGIVTNGGVASHRARRASAQHPHDPAVRWLRRLQARGA